MIGTTDPEFVRNAHTRRREPRGGAASSLERVGCSRQHDRDL